MIYDNFLKLIAIITKHDEVGRLSVHVLGIETAVEQLGVATSAVDVLLVLDGELDNDRLVAVRKWLEFGRRGVELGVLAGLDALALLSVSVELAGGQNELTGVGTFVCRADPSFFPCI